MFNLTITAKITRHYCALPLLPIGQTKSDKQEDLRIVLLIISEICLNNCFTYENVT